MVFFYLTKTLEGLLLIAWWLPILLLFAFFPCMGGCGVAQVSGSGHNKGPASTHATAKVVAPAYDGYPPAVRDFILSIEATPRHCKTGVARVSPQEGLILMLSEAQIEMLADESPDFSPTARIERGLAACKADFFSATSPLGLSNFEYLMGGRNEPNPFLVSVIEGGKIRVMPYPLRESTVTRIQNLLESGQGEAVDKQDCMVLEEIILDDPTTPMLHYLAAGCYQQTGEVARSVYHLEKEIEVNPSHPESHLALADLLIDAGAHREGIEKIILAMYFHPSWDAPGKLLEKRTGCKRREGIFEPEVLIDVAPTGVVVVACSEKDAWLKPYAMCKAAFRYCPEVRMSFGMKAQPYKLSLMEEVTCLTIAATQKVPSATGVAQSLGDDELKKLLQTVVNNGVTAEFALFEVLGRFHPDYMKFLPPEVKERVINYIKSYVIVGC